MKPNFALDLSHDGISLLHRGISGWSLVGEVALDDPMMGTHLAELRRSASELESGGVTTKLIIPNSQLLYTTLEAPGPDDIAREVQIRAALEGLTPYPVGDLVFDWRAEGEQARVAVLARETMDEAENFAVEHRFNPVSFVARPDSGDFSGEPFFGKTRAATRILPPGERLIPDTSPVPRRPRAMELPADARVEDVAAPAESPAESPAQETAAQGARNSAPSWKRELPDPFAGFDEAADPSWPEPEPDLPAVAAPEPEPDNFSDPAPPAAPDEPPARSETKPAGARNAARKTPARRKPARDDASSGAQAGPMLAPFPPTPDEADAAPRPAPRSAPRPRRADSSEAGSPATGAAVDEPAGPTPWNERGAPGQAAASSPPPLAMPETGPAAGAVTGTPPPLPFHTRRDPNSSDMAAEPPAKPIDFNARPNGAARPVPAVAAPTTSAPDGGRRVDLPPDPPPRLDSLRADMAEALKKPLPVADKPLDTRRGGFFGRVSRLAGVRRDRAGTAASGDAKATESKVEALAPKAPIKTPDSAPAKSRPATPLPATSKPDGKSGDRGQRKSDAEAMTVFGARRTKELDRRPRYLGLILTLGLILAMAIVALWSTVFAPADDEVSLFNPGPEVAVAPGNDIPPATAETPPGGTAPDAENAPNNPPTPESLPATSPPPVVDPAAIEEAVTAAQPPASPPSPVTGEVLSPEAAEARYAATGIWQRAPEPMADPDTARADAPSPAMLSQVAAMPDVPALPAAGTANTEIPPANTMAPPPPGTSFALDADGLVVASAEGTVAPSGILVYAGRPAQVPPPRPIEAGAPRAEGVPRAKPLPRPANLAIPADPFVPDPPVVVPQIEAPAETPAETPAPTPADGAADGAALDQPAQTPAPDTPLVRSDLAAVTPMARPDDLVVATSNAPDGGLIDAAVGGVIDAAFADASEYAVARSIQPQHRPDNFAAIVDSVREAMSDGSRVAAAPSAPASAAPVIPASADVAARATVENALNLRDVNLIGIYGGSSSRRALVRLENGRYVKVKVGDRLDGGQVTSITASQLTYQKGRKVYALEVLPLG